MRPSEGKAVMFSAGQTWMVAHRNFVSVLQKVAQAIGGEQCVPFPATPGHRGRAEKGERFPLVLRLVCLRVSFSEVLWQWLAVFSMPQLLKSQVFLI